MNNNVTSIFLFFFRCGVNIQEYADMLIRYLPQLWELSQHHNLLRGAVLNVLNYLVQVCGSCLKQFQN